MTALIEEKLAEGDSEEEDEEYRKRLEKELEEFSEGGFR